MTPPPPDVPVRFEFPARARYLALIRATAGAFAEHLGWDEDRVRDLVLAVDELAAVIIGEVRTGQLCVEFDHDGQDLYVRLSSPVAADRVVSPKTPELTVLLLQATVDSFDLRHHRDELVGVLQRSLRQTTS